MPRARQGTSRRTPRPVARLVVLAAIGICLVAVLGTLSSSGVDDKAGDQPTAKQRAEQRKARDSANGTDGKTGSATKKSSYRVRAGDSFGSIAEKVGMPVEELQQLNPDIDPRALQPGQRLKLR